MNTNTLEQRLQNVARTFVSSRGPRQHSQQPPSRPGSATGLPQMPHLSNGFSATNTPQSSFTGANGFPAGMANPIQQQQAQQQQQHQAQQQQQQQQQAQQQQQQQTQQRPASAMGQNVQLQKSMQPVSRPTSALGNAGVPINGMPVQPAASAKTQQSPSQNRNQLDLTSPSLGPDNGLGSIGLAGQQQPGMLRPQQQLPSANGPVMSNGKPALLRGAAARDGGTWAQGPSMVCCVTISICQHDSSLLPVC